MSSTYVTFRGHGFDASDPTLEVWLALLVDEAIGLEEPAGWLEDAITQWEVTATAHFGSGADPALDDIVIDEERRKLVLALCLGAWHRLVGWGDPVSAQTLNGLRDWGPGYVFTKDVPAATLRRPALYFAKLLRGDLGPNETDARFDDPEADVQLSDENALGPLPLSP